jgi:hypothetical protein
MNFNNQHVDCKVSFNENYSLITITGNVKNPAQFKYMILTAPAPIDRMSNYSGSGLPFPSYEIALDETPNKLVINSDGVFSTVFKYPNSFYEYNESTYQNDKILSPIIFILGSDVNEISVRFELHDLNVLRTLVNRSGRKNPEFYGAKDYIVPITTAENTMMYYSKAKIENDIG